MWCMLASLLLLCEKALKTMFVFQKVVSGKPLSKLFCICLPLEKLVNEKHFPVNGKYFSVNRKHFSIKWKFGLVFRKVFSFILGGKHFPEVVKKLEMSYYLLIISNLVLKLLIAIYILFWIFVFQFHPYNLFFILILVLIFIIVICFSLVIF